jgi:hypothetical protein
MSDSSEREKSAETSKANSKQSPAEFARALKAIKREKQEAARLAAEPQPCCDHLVHITYRGISDDRMYISHDRQFAEIKYFRPNSLRVFCAGCRRRLIPPVSTEKPSLPSRQIQDKQSE